MSMASVVFVGHGSPVNAIEDNEYTREWRRIGSEIERPSAVIAVSDRWVTKGTMINGSDYPKQVFDVFGYPKALYRAEYHCLGDPKLARRLRRAIGKATLDDSWGVDSGVWPVLRHMLPDADVPVVPLSIDRRLSPEGHYELGKKLGAFADDSVMILCCGNIICDLRLVDPALEEGYDWADAFSAEVKDRILSRDVSSLIDCYKLPAYDDRVLSSPFHFYPLLYALGAAGENYRSEIFCDSRIYGSVDMTGVVLWRE